MKKVNVDKTWASFRKKSKIQFSRQIKSLDGSIRDHRYAIQELKARKDKLQEQLDSVDEKVKEALRTHNYMVELGKTRPNKQSSKALISRDLCHIVHMCSAKTNLSYTNAKLEATPVLWCDKWFDDFLLAAPSRSDYHIYDRLEKLRDVQDHEDIESYIGMLFLEVT